MDELLGVFEHRPSCTLVQYSEEGAQNTTTQIANYRSPIYMIQKRPPIVVVMGHVDHGKTTLLDYIRKANIAAKEAGGITQSIGAYEIIYQSQINADNQCGSAPIDQRKSALVESPRESANERITFIDTPGHEAFSKMRQRGAKAADIGILVVAVDDGVQPQTIEAFKILEESKTPVIVAINKIDKSGVDLNKVKNDLAQAGILLEGYGGNISWQAISAKTGEGVNELLDLILLAAELENLSYDPALPVEGFILEANLTSRSGITVSAVIKNGILRIGDEVFSPTVSGKIKSLKNFLGKPVKEAAPSMPVLILGFIELPEVGDVFTTESGIRNQESGIKKNKVRENIIKENVGINLILKADTAGSLEALSQIIRNLPLEIAKLAIVDESVGEITDGDVKLAIATRSAIIGFRSKVQKAADNLARAHKIKIVTSDIVYHLTQNIATDLQNLNKEVVTGDLEILALFGKKASRAKTKTSSIRGEQIVGGKVVIGEIKNNSTVEIKRGENILGTGKIVNLQQGKADVKKVEVGNECGMMLSTEISVNVGDHLVQKF